MLPVFIVSIILLMQGGNRDSTTFSSVSVGGSTAVVVSVYSGFSTVL
ncbi:MAG: hypothetical protein QXI85_04405 [Desulfurococcaceae archaeon]